MSQAVRILALAAMLALTGCATTNPKDPLEKFNRAMFDFNDTVDRAAIKPAAQAYSKLPSFVQTGVFNFFGNLSDVGTSVNNLLQGKFADGLSDVMRVAVNSTLGFGGLLDIASEAGLAKHKEDFGQTLGKWGVGSGPYLVLPILGPSTVRDASVLPVDFAADPWSYKYPVAWRNAGGGLRLLDQRAALLDATNLLEDAALDRYEFVRDAYLQRRESTIRDGETSRSSYEDEPDPLAQSHEKRENGVESSAPAISGEAAPMADKEPAIEPVVIEEKQGAYSGVFDAVPKEAIRSLKLVETDKAPLNKTPVSSSSPAE